MTRKIFLLCVILTMCSSCSGFALLASGGSLVISQNSYSKMYNSIDVFTIMGTKKDIKAHTYEKVKKVITERN